MMITRLNEEVLGLLCCSLCKSDLMVTQKFFCCKSCGLIFPSRDVRIGQDKYEKVFDFRIHRPPYSISRGHNLWKVAQHECEKYYQRAAAHDSMRIYLDEIESVREIYTEEFHINGKVLDVGGYQGRLRYYLGDDVNLYISVDPSLNIFENIGEQKNLLKAYPCLLSPLNFVLAHAEYLPFKSNSFDWIHMRSVIDHFEDPFLAFIEAFRLCRTGGKLLVGLTIKQKQLELRLAENKRGNVSLPSRIIDKIKLYGFNALVIATMRKFFIQKRSKKNSYYVDDHTFRLKYSELMDLFGKTGWKVLKEHWQKPPFNYCIYICCETKESIQRI